MNYPDGAPVRLGDKVECWEGCHGVVVASMDTDEYSPDFPREEWGYLEMGVLIETDQAGLVHYDEPERDMKLVERAT